MEGDSVTLHTDLTHIQTDDHILWRFGPKEAHIAEIHNQSTNITESNKKFGDRLKLDIQTGSLTITNIRITDSGLYKLLIINSSGSSNRTFSVTVCGVFGDTGEVKTVSVMEGDSVTLHTDLTHIQTNDHILWMFGPKESRIADIHEKLIDTNDSKETFGDRLKLDIQTGSLTITNIRITDSGLYKLLIINSSGSSNRTFSVTVCAHLPVPVITRDSPQNSSSNSTCVLLCSVMNVTHVTLSWYKGNSLFSSISVSDLNISLSLPLEVEYQDTNTYSCVLNNPIRNQTQHLHITDVCQPCSGFYQTALVVSGAVVLVVIIGAVLILVVKCRLNTRQAGQQAQEEEVIHMNGININMRSDSNEVSNGNCHYSD